MAKRLQKDEGPAEIAHRALSRVLDLAGDSEEESLADKDPRAVALGRKGGLAGGKVGGKARAAALSPERRKEIAKKAADARWAKRDSEES